MSGEPPSTRLDARELRTRWPGLVWAVPLAAILVVVYLALNALADRGVDVVVSFSKSGGARAGDTPVVYKGVRVGRVVKIRVSRDAKRVDMTLRMASETRDALRDGAAFWLIGASPSLTNLSSLQAVVSGVSIGASPGSGSPRRRFIGLDEPPTVPTGEAGSPYLLTTDALGSTRVGAGVYYRGLEVGRVTRAAMAPDARFELNIFVAAPYDQLVRPATRFSSIKPLQIAFTSSGIEGQLGPGASLLTGGVEFDTPAASVGPRSPAGAVFPLYANAAAADDPVTGRGVPYRAVFRAAGGALHPGAPISLAGFPIGRVTGRRLQVDRDGRSVAAGISLEIEPASLGLEDTGGEPDRRARTDRLLSGLIRRGYRLELVQTPPLVGSPALVLRQIPAAERAATEIDGPLDALPTADSVGFDTLAARADNLVARLEAIPVEAIGRNLRQLTGRLSGLIGSPEVGEALTHLDHTLAELDQMTAEVSPKVAPMVEKLSSAANQLDALARSADQVLGSSGPQDANLPDAIHQLTEAARSIRTLADDLDRHPEALLRGKRSR
jgi:paraquat-inducible protein B